MGDQLLFRWEYKRGFPDRRFIGGCMALEKIPNTKLNAAMDKYHHLCASVQNSENAVSC